jgi:DNA-binding CsgD family transcriptional regulator
MLSVRRSGRATDEEVQPLVFDRPIRSTTKRLPDDQQIQGLASLLDHVHDNVIALDYSGRCVHANRALRTLLGCSTDESLTSIPLDALLSRGTFEDIRYSWFGPVHSGEWNGQPLMLLRVDTEVRMAPVALMPPNTSMETLIEMLQQALSTIESPPVDQRSPESPPPNLSLREKQILQLVGEGKRPSTIADLLFLSEHTVRNHLKRLYRKLGVHSAAELRERRSGYESSP